MAKTDGSYFQGADKGLYSKRLRQFTQGSWRDIDDIIAPEMRVRVHWSGNAPKELLAFPDSEAGLRRLALGHALLDISEPGVVPELVRRDDSDDGRVMDFHLEPEWTPRDPTRSKGFEALGAETILQRMKEFIAAAGRWEDTGCFHRMALYAPEKGEFVAWVEDIGRHNCLDRLAGWCVEHYAAPADMVLFASARATGSLVAKALRAGFAMLVSRSAVTTAGVELAQEGGMSLLGFARDIRFTVFADPKGLVYDPMK